MNVLRRWKEKGVRGMTDKCCGNCAYFEGEDIFGNGICTSEKVKMINKKAVLRECIDKCDFWEERGK